MTYETLLIAREGPVVLVTLNRPHRANTISHQLRLDMLDLLDKVEQDRSMRVLIFTGEGRHFCGGADLKEIRGEGKGPISADFMDRLADSRAVTIAAINGAAMGGGYEIALACDFRVMSSETNIGLPEIKFGGLPAGGGTQRLPRLVGPAIAKRAILLGEPFDAPTALTLGMVDEVAAPGALLGRCRTLADTLAARPDFASETGKRLINRGLDLELPAALDLERTAIRNMATPQMQKEAQSAAAATDAAYGRIFGS